MDDPMVFEDRKPEPRMIPLPDPDLPGWLNEEVLPLFNESTLARNVYLVVRAACRYQERKDCWPTRRDLFDAVRGSGMRAEDFEVALDSVTILGHEVYLYRVRNSRGRPTYRIGFTDRMHRWGAGEGTTMTRPVGTRNYS